MMTVGKATMESDSPWAISEADFPWTGSAAQRLRFVLRYAILAPSNYNSQPWLFRIVGDDIELYADRRRGLAVIDPDDRELVMSCGAALYNLRLAMRYFGYEPVVRLFPDLDDTDLLAFVRFGRPMEKDENIDLLFHALLRRRTNRLVLEGGTLGENIFERLSAAARVEGAELHRVSGPNVRAQMAALVERGVLTQGSDKHYRRELAAWIHPNRSSSRDGVPGHAQGLGDLRSIAEPLILRASDWGPERGAQLRDTVIDAPELVVLTTKSDSTHTWLEAGQALQAVLLTGTDAGLAASFLNHAIQIQELRMQVSNVIGAEGSIPQTMLRIGRGGPMQPTPRRPISEVLTSNKYL